MLFIHLTGVHEEITRFHIYLRLIVLYHTSHMLMNLQENHQKKRPKQSNGKKILKTSELYLFHVRNLSDPRRTHHITRAAGHLVVTEEERGSSGSI